MKITDEDKSYFPIRSSKEFYEFFECHVSRAYHEGIEPNLALLSITIGYLEHKLTLTKSGDLHSSSAESDGGDLATKQNTSVNSSKTKSGDADMNSEFSDEFPVIDFDVVEMLYVKFLMTVKSLVDKSLPENTTRGGYATKQLCKKVSNIMWNRLNPHYHKDKAHIQSLFSFLTGRQLDCFGLAFAVIAACQIMKYSDVHLVLSEDHAWATHGDNSKEMTEITWHGKGNEDKRGFSVRPADVEKSWVYLNGHSIVCDRMIEVSAMIVAINPSIDAHTDSKVMHELQKRMLHFMYNIGALDKYPVGLCILGELEESERFYKLAVKCVEEHYQKSHVFPYCYQGHFHYRNGQGKAAIQCWAKAAQVLSNYNYTREDEEVYKEIMEIAGELILQAMRNDPSVCEDCECFMDLIRFYDGICLWEEESPTPVLHSWWAKYFTQSLGRFTNEVRESFKGDKENEERKNEMKAASTAVGSRKSQRHSLRKESLDSGVCDDAKTMSKLGVKSVKMRGLEELLICGKKINTHTVSLQLTAQSQVHFVKRRSNVSDYAMEYAGLKRSKFYD